MRVVRFSGFGLLVIYLVLHLLSPTVWSELFAFNIIPVAAIMGISCTPHISDRVAVMYLGEIVELADRQSLFANPRHPYTKALLNAVPSVNSSQRSSKGRTRLKGDPPSPINLPKGCRFASRCPQAEPQCSQFSPPLSERTNGHKVACFLAQ